MQAKEWIVGLDLRPSSQGALAMARWLQKHSRTPPRFRSVHVMEDATLRVALRQTGFEQLREQALDKARAVTATHLPDRTEVSVVRAASADESLAAAARFHDASGILVGRQAFRNEDRLVLLGRVARRLVRTLPVPVLVVPPDLREEEIGEGPVLVAIDMHEASLAAVAYGRELAETIGRPMELVHVTALPEFWGEPYAPIQSLEAARVEIAREAEPELRKWLAEHGLSDLKLHFRQGYVSERIVQVADSLKAPVIVCGSRHLGLVQRWFQSSVGTALAGSARTAVAVVGQPG